VFAFGLNGIQHADALQCFHGHGAVVGLVQIEEFTTRMSPAA
jgi:hypothetical protein